MKGMLTVAKNSSNIEFLTYAYSMGIRDYRLNMDYGVQAFAAWELLAGLAKDDVRIFADFQGVKMRIQLEEGQNDVVVHAGDIVSFHTTADGYPYIKNFSFVSDHVKPGQQICIADGKIVGDIIACEKGNVIVELKSAAYVLRQNAGCSIIGKDIPNARMTRKACGEISLSPMITERRTNWVILSFVDSAQEIGPFVDEMHALNIKVMAKVETMSGVDHIKEIAEVVDGFMIGRGDLKNTANGLYSRYYDKALGLVASCKRDFSGVGTFFLSHFSDSGILETYEKNDVLSVKEKGLDYVMLSKEVVNSKYPYETVKALVDLCQG